MPRENGNAMKFNYTFSRSDANKHSGVILEFLLCRASIQEVHILGLSKFEVDLSNFPASVEVRWHGKVTVDEATVILIYQGEVLLRKEPIFISNASKIGSTSIEALFKKRQELVDDLQDPQIKKFESFFLDYDRQTFLDDRLNSNTGNIAPTVTYLMQSIHNKATKSDILKPTISEKIISAVSDLQLRIFVTHFSKKNTQDKSDTLDLNGIQSAFEYFSKGGLSNKNNPNKSDELNAKPNSAHYFLWAEFALAAIEMNIGNPEWESLLPILVKTQKIYMAAYAPNIEKENRWFEDWRPTDNNFQPRHPVLDTAPINDSIDPCPKGMKLYDYWVTIHTKHVQEAFKNGIRGYEKL